MPDTLTFSRHATMRPVIGSLSGFGWSARLLGHYGREAGVLTLEEAVRKVTSLRTERLGLRGRDRIEVGAAADIVVFDAAAVQDRSSLSQPRRHPVGFAHVLLGGVFTLRGGERTASNPGRVIRGAH